MSTDSLAGQLPAALPGLMRYAHSLAGRPEDAADLVQDTIERALARADSFDGRSSAATWLHRIMHNLYVDRGRARREEPVADMAVLVEAMWRDDAYTVDAAAVALRAADRDVMRDALAHLPEIYRTALVLHDAEGMTMADVAQVAGVGLPAAKQRLRRGRMMLVTALAEEQVRDRRGVPMRCWEARSQVSDYLDGALPSPAAALLESHLAACQTCPPLYSSLVAARSALASRLAGDTSDPDSVVPPELAARIRDLAKGGTEASPGP